MQLVASSRSSCGLLTGRYRCGRNTILRVLHSRFSPGWDANPTRDANRLEPGGGAAKGNDPDHAATRAPATEEDPMKLVRFGDINGRETFVQRGPRKLRQRLRKRNNRNQLWRKGCDRQRRDGVSAVASTLLKEAKPR